MAVKEILQMGHPALSAVCEPIHKINKQVWNLLDDMADTMYHTQGVGLAAPQIGVTKRVVVIDTGEEDSEYLELINPEITACSGEVTDQEGCLSLMGFIGDVTRYETVSVQALTRHGKRIRIKNATGLLARALQHEIDHLDGKMYVEKAVNLRKPPPVEENNINEVDKEV